MIDQIELPPKPRVRVRVRREDRMTVGGLEALVDGYHQSFAHKLHRLLGSKGRVRKLEFIGWNGDYDHYRVIYD